ncbi:MAG TPA: redoxin domain-containing protein [Pyrinomonadaceae bacterium]|jgi:peroxiredoxin
MPPAGSDQLLFGALVAHLRQRGFVVGVDQYLRLQVLLARVGGRCTPAQLKTLLCPLFATSARQQAQFYQAFDEHFALFHPDENGAAADATGGGTPQAATFKAARRARRAWRAYLLAALVLAVGVALAIVAWRRQSTTPPSPPTDNTAVEPPAADAPATAETPPELQVPAPASSPDTPAPPAGWRDLIASYIARHKLALQVAAVAAPLLLFLVYEWYRFRRRRLLLQREREKTPPYAWPVRVEGGAPKLFDSEQFYNAARLLRRRQVAEHFHLDVEATIAATIDALGFPVFRFRPASRVPEYIVLIERASYRDHQARLFDEQARALEAEGLHATRYFYDGDPRVCYDEQEGGQSVHLFELENKYGGHRLLVFGSGDELLDPVTGQPEDWTSVFAHWPERAVLTPESPARWGVREQALAQLFLVLPATMNSLRALVDLFEAAAPDPYAPPAEQSALAALPRLDADADAAAQIEVLRRTLGPEVFQWLCAAAVYPELQWDLTLYLATLDCMPRGLLTEENLLKLVRLPWLRRGALPDELRWHLIRALEPARERGVRAALVAALEQHPAPPQTFAQDEYRLNLFAQRWLHSRTRKHLQQLLRLMKRLPRSLALRDYTLLRFLETAKTSPLDFVLPGRLRALFYQRGLPPFGLRTGARLALTLALVAGLTVALRALTPRASDNANKPPTEDATAKATPTPLGTDGGPVATNASFESIPDLNLLTLTGQPYSLSRLRGRVVLLNFWAASCADCVAQTAKLNALNRDYQARGLAVVGVITGDTAEALAAQQGMKPNYGLLRIDDADVPAELRLGTSRPVTYAIDSEGRFRQQFVGSQDRATLEATVQRLLAEVPLVAANPTPTPTPKPTPTPALDDPAALKGVWGGTAHQYNNDSYWTVKLTVSNGAYKIDYPSLGCGGYWTLTGRRPNVFNFKEKITYNPPGCVDNGTVVLIRRGANQLYFSFSSLPSGQETSSATLTRNLVPAAPKTARADAMTGGNQNTAPGTGNQNITRGAADPASELTFWESIRNSNDPEDYQAFLDKYPQGTFAALARRRLQTLRQGTKTEQAAPPSESAKSEPLKPQTPTVTRVGAFSPDGRLAASTPDGYTVVLTDVKSGQVVAQDLQLTPINTLLFSPDGKILAAGGANRVLLFTVLELKLVRRFSISFHATSLRFSHDGSKLVAAGPQGAVELNVADGSVKPLSPGKEKGKDKKDLPLP